MSRFVAFATSPPSLRRYFLPRFRFAAITPSHATSFSPALLSLFLRLMRAAPFRHVFITLASYFVAAAARSLCAQRGKQSVAAAPRCATSDAAMALRDASSALAAPRDAQREYSARGVLRARAHARAAAPCLCFRFFYAYVAAVFCCHFYHATMPTGFYMLLFRFIDDFAIAMPLLRYDSCRWLFR